MTNQEAKEAARKLGLTAWKRRVHDANGTWRSVKCVGFASANFAIAYGDTWEEALDEAAGLVFSA